MNRAMRRKIINNPKILETTFNEYAKEQQLKAIRLTLESFSAVIAISLHDKFGWGKDRINKLLDYAGNQYACCLENKVKIEEIIQWVKDYGVRIDGVK